MARPPSIQWYYKQWLGDNKVLAMDWDSRGMHHWLLMLSIQEEPPGSIPNDMDAIRRWLGLARSTDEMVWRRVRPQIFAAWSLRDNRWFNSGMESTFERKENYRTSRVPDEYETGTKSPPNPAKDVVGSLVVESSKSKPSIEEVIQYCKERQNHVDPQKWFDYYSSNGWKVGRNAMKDWRAAVRTWEKNGYGENQQVSQTKQREPTAQVARYHNNRTELARAFGASAVGGTSGANSSRQAARLSSGDTPALEGETKEPQR